MLEQLGTHPVVRLLVGQDDLRVDDGNRLGSTPVHGLRHELKVRRVLSVVVGILVASVVVALGRHPYLLSSVEMLEHHSQVLFLVDLDLAYCGTPISRENFVIRVHLRAPLIIVVVVRTVGLLAASSRWKPALARLIVVRMVLLLFPTMTAVATVLHLAAIMVRLSILTSLPIRTLVSIIFKQVGLSAEVLPVVRVHADVSLVLLVREGTPDGFKMEEIEVGVMLHLVKHIN